MTPNRSTRLLAMSLICALLAILGSVHSKHPRSKHVRDRSYTQFSVCASLKTFLRQNRCIAATALQIDREKGLTQLGQSLDVAAKNVHLLKSCHFAVHPLGEKLGVRDALNGRRTPEYVASPTLCSQGLMHGIMIGFLRNANARQLASFSPIKHCPMANGSSNYRHLSGCVHGIGHSAYLRLQSTTKAFDICHTISERMPMRLSKSTLISCGYGVAMQNMQSHNGNVTDCGPTTDRYRYLRLSCLGVLRMSSWIKGDHVDNAQKRCLELTKSAFELSSCNFDVRELFGSSQFKF